MHGGLRFREPHVHDYLDPIASGQGDLVLRGTTLYRRPLLVRPDLNDANSPFPIPQPGGVPPVPPLPVPPPIGTAGAGPNFYAMCDLSVRATGGYYDLSPSPVVAAPNMKIAANSLEDLTSRENRFAHRPLIVGTAAPRHDPARLAARHAQLGDFFPVQHRHRFHGYRTEWSLRLSRPAVRGQSDPGPAGAADTGRMHFAELVPARNRGSDQPERPANLTG